MLLCAYSSKRGVILASIDSFSPFSKTTMFVRILCTTPNSNLQQTVKFVVFEINFANLLSNKNSISFNEILNERCKSLQGPISTPLSKGSIGSISSLRLVDSQCGSPQRSGFCFAAGS